MVATGQVTRRATARRDSTRQLMQAPAIFSRVSESYVEVRRTKQDPFQVLLSPTTELRRFGNTQTTTEFSVVGVAFGELAMAHIFILKCTC